MSKRAHYESHERQTGKRPKALDGPECPRDLIYLLEWYREISVFRRYGFAGPERLTPLDIAGYALLTGDWPQKWETEVLARLDIAELEGMASKSKPVRKLRGE